MPDQPATISFDDFTKINMRVGRITEASDHPNADKLVTIDIERPEDG